MPVPNAGHEDQTQVWFTTVECRGLQLPKAAMFLQLEHVAYGTLGTLDRMVRIPSPANSSVKQRNRIDRGNRMIIIAFQPSHHLVVFSISPVRFSEPLAGVASL
ncbi:hypothetical protein PIB30_087716 [Stylosanthes scabra]|uniref:Uncharacterized protein n=1 Tax=Stylosanthes scabra TaxID=79078 RepID=A0ABU6VUN5_9FABA|nr:hypothetical protein [Stylosanthes scabra]